MATDLPQTLKDALDAIGIILERPQSTTDIPKRQKTPTGGIQPPWIPSYPNEEPPF